MTSQHYLVGDVATLIPGQATQPYGIAERSGTLQRESVVAVARLVQCAQGFVGQLVCRSFVAGEVYSRLSECGRELLGPLTRGSRSAITDAQPPPPLPTVWRSVLPGRLARPRSTAEGRGRGDDRRYEAGRLRRSRGGAAQ